MPCFASLLLGLLWDTVVSVSLRLDIVPISDIGLGFDILR